MKKKEKGLKLRERVLAYVVEHQKRSVIPPVIIAVVLLAALILFAGYERNDARSYNTENAAHATSSDDVVRVSIAGDIVMGRNVQKRAESLSDKDAQGANGYVWMLKRMQDLWVDSDFVMANLDTSVIDGDLDNYEELESKDVYFSTDKSNLRYLKDSGIDILSIATDHIADYGRRTIKTAVEELDALGIKHVGAGEDREKAAQYEILTAEVEGRTQPIRIAVFGALGYQAEGYGARAPRVTGTATDLWNDPTVFDPAYSDTTSSDLSTSDTVSSDMAALNTAEPYDPWEVTAGTFSGRNAMMTMSIADARQFADVIIVYMHWGDDRMLYETDDMRELAYSYIDAGADIVVGTNPRILLPAEKYVKNNRSGIVLYSIGSLLYDSAETRMCDSMMLDLVVDAELNRTVEITPLRINSGIPEKTENEFYQKRIINTLTKNMDEKDYTIESGKLIIELGQKRGRSK